MKITLLGLIIFASHLAVFKSYFLFFFLSKWTKHLLSELLTVWGEKCTVLINGLAPFKIFYEQQK